MEEYSIIQINCLLLIQIFLQFTVYVYVMNYKLIPMIMYNIVSLLMVKITTNKKIYIL